MLVFRKRSARCFPFRVFLFSLSPTVSYQLFSCPADVLSIHFVSIWTLVFIAQRYRNVNLDTLTIWSSHVVEFCRVERRYQSSRRSTNIPGGRHSDPRGRNTCWEDSDILPPRRQRSPESSVHSLAAPDHGRSGLDRKYQTSAGRQYIETQARLHCRQLTA